MLTDIIPASARKVVYGIFGVLGLALAALQAAFLAQHTEPTWLVMALAAYGVASAGVHATANSNTAAPSGATNGRSETGAVDVLTVALIALIVVVILVLLHVV